MIRDDAGCNERSLRNSASSVVVISKVVFECKKQAKAKRSGTALFHVLASKMGNGASAPKNKVGKRVVREVSVHIFYTVSDLPLVRVLSCKPN